MTDEINFTAALKDIIERHAIPSQNCDPAAGDITGCPCDPTDSSTIPPGYRCVPGRETGDLGYLSRDSAFSKQDPDTSKLFIDFSSIDFAGKDNKAQLVEAIFELGSLDIKLAAKIKELEDLGQIIKIFNHRYHEELVKNN